MLSYEAVAGDAVQPPQMETLVHGRAGLTAGAERTLDFADLAPELSAGIGVYKRASAGGLIDSWAAGGRLARRGAGNAPGLIVAAAALMADPYGDFFPGAASSGNGMVADLADARDAPALRRGIGVLPADRQISLSAAIRL